jgi:hypothetical protein
MTEPSAMAMERARNLVTSIVRSSEGGCGCSLDPCGFHAPFVTRLLSFAESYAAERVEGLRGALVPASPPAPGLE